VARRLRSITPPGVTPRAAGGGQTGSMQEPTGGRQVYQLTVHGEMSEVIQAEFDDFELQVSHGETHLEADLPDSAALYGLIGRIEALGLVLLDLHRSQGSAPIDESASGPTSGPVPSANISGVSSPQGPNDVPPRS
jgi:hypothetical protein